MYAKCKLCIRKKRSVRKKLVKKQSTRSKRSSSKNKNSVMRKKRNLIKKIKKKQSSSSISPKITSSLPVNLNSSEENQFEIDSFNNQCEICSKEITNGLLMIALPCKHVIIFFHSIIYIRERGAGADHNKKSAARI